MRTKQQVTDILRAHLDKLRELGLYRIGIYGSLVKGTAHSDSDIDILIALRDGMETFESYMAIYDLLESLLDGDKVDMVTQNGLSPYIGPRILEEVEYV